MSKPRILLVQTQAENAGAQEISRLLGAGLRQRGFEISNLFFFQQSPSFDAPEGTAYCAPRRPTGLVPLLRLLLNLARGIQRARPDVVITFQHYGNTIGGAMARLVSSAPVIANQVSSPAAMNRPVRALDLVMGTLGLFRSITVNSHETLRDYASYPAGYRKRLTHVPHGFDQKRADLPKPDARRQFGLPADGIVLGSVARLHPLKQLDAAIRLLPGHPTWTLALAGQGPDEPRLRQTADQLGVADRVVFVGEIAPEAIGRFLAGLDVFVFPTLAESFGLAAVEAANAGVPVVANDLPVLREVLSFQGKPAALFVDAADTAAFAATVAEVVEDAGLREGLRDHGRGLAARYSIDAMVDDYVRLIETANCTTLINTRPIHDH